MNQAASSAAGAAFLGKPARQSMPGRVAPVSCGNRRAGTKKPTSSALAPQASGIEGMGGSRSVALNQDFKNTITLRFVYFGIAAVVAALALALIAMAYLDPTLRKAIVYAGLGLC